MAGCSVVHEAAGDPDAAQGRVLGWVLGGALLGGLAGFLSAAGPLTGVAAIGGVAALQIIGIIAFTALGLAIVGFFVGFAVNWFDRLFPHSPSEITMSGCVLCAGKNTGIPPWHDNDWTFNLGGRTLALLAPTNAGLTVSEIRNRDAPGGGPAFPVLDPTTRQPALHCEITSNIGNYAAVGGAVGSVAGAIAGAIIGGVICVALGIATFGIGALACLLIVAIAIALGAAVGGIVGEALGAAAGWVADELSDFDERGEAIGRGCLMILTGRWITDSSHQWNEIHDIESAQLVECNDCHEDKPEGGGPGGGPAGGGPPGGGPPGGGPPEDLPPGGGPPEGRPPGGGPPEDRPPRGKKSAGLIAAVAIGRHPTGRDP